jgi:glycerol-3-phosphate acyltransferase PlsY
MSWLIIIMAYLLGSIPTAYIAGHILRGRDIRQMGDGNMGAQNAFRQLGARTGVAVFITDAAKGALVILIAQAADVSQILVLVSGAAAVAGHNWPIFLGFRGGRGESTTIGILATLVIVPMLIVGGAAIAVLLKAKSVTKASAILFVPLPLLCWWWGYSGLLVAYSMFLPALVGFTHYIRTRQRIARPA